MTAPQPTPNHDAAWRIRALEQFSACLAAEGKRPDLEALLSRTENSPSEAKVRFYVAVALAAEGNLREAQEHLRRTMTLNGQDPKPRQLAYKLLVRQADQRAGAQDWDGLSEVVAEAISMAPPGVDPARDLARFNNALPIANLRAGRREEAIRLWERQLCDGPADVRLLHHLALAHYWWAQVQEKENQSGPLLTTVWKGTIAYWTVLLNMDPFWDSWNQSNQRRWGIALSPQEVASLRNELAEQRIAHHLQSRESEYREREDAGAGWLYEDLLVSLIREQKSAAAWKELMGALERQKIFPSDAVLRLAGGYLFFERLGRSASIHESIGHLMVDSGTRAVQWVNSQTRTTLDLPADCLARLCIYFSPAGLGSIAVMIDDRHKPAEAIALLDVLPKNIQSSWPAMYLRVMADAKLASVLAGQGKTGEAVEAWKRARKLALSFDPKVAAQAGGILHDLPGQFSGEAVKAVQKESARLKTENQLDQAVALLEQCLELDKDNALRDLLCILYCDRGGAHLNKSSYPAARDDYKRALRLNPQHQRAKEGLSTTYNNEGCDESNNEKSIKLLEKAIEINPNNHRAKRNLASSLKAKAVDEVNSAVERVRYSGRGPVVRELDKAIELLERAAKMAKPNLGSEFFSAISGAAMLDEGSMENLFSQVDDDVLKGILTNLAVAHRMRHRMRIGG